MATISLPGLATSIDTTAIVNQLIAADSVPLNRLQTEKTTDQQKAAAVTDLQQSLTTFGGLVNQLRNMQTLDTTRASSSDSTVLTAMSAAGAVEGNHQIEVNQIATSSRQVNAGLAAATTPVGTGNFVYTYNGQTRTIVTNDKTTLQDLADLINNDSSNPGVTASLLQYKVDDSHNYHLVLTGKQTGSAYNINVEAATTLAGFDAGSFTQRAAGDAQFRVDGYPSGQWISRSSNVITDVISNVTLTLQGEGTTNVSVTADDSQLQTNLNSLVSSYNSLLDKIQQYTGYDASSKTSGVLAGDFTIASLLNGSQSALSGMALGFTGSDTYSLAAQIGLVLGKNADTGGTVSAKDANRLSLDTTALSDALTKDRSAVLALLGVSGTGSTSNDDIRYDSALSSTKPGTYEVQVDYDAGGAVTAARIRVLGSQTWDNAQINGNVVTGPSGKPEAGLQFTVLNPGTSETKSYQVRVQQGIAGTMYDSIQSMLDTVHGPLADKQTEIEADMKQLDDNIATQQQRLDEEKTRLTAQYARLEATMTQIQSLNAAYQSLFQSLGQTSSSNSSNSSSSSKSSG